MANFNLLGDLAGNLSSITFSQYFEIRAVLENELISCECESRLNFENGFQKEKKHH